MRWLYSLLAVSLLIGSPPGAPVFGAVSFAATQGGRKIFLCTGDIERKPNPYHREILIGTRTLYAVVETGLPKSELERQWSALIQSRVSYQPTCSEARDRESAIDNLEYSERMFYAVHNKIDFVPQEDEPEQSDGKRQTVPFRSPNGDDRGFSGVVFDVEYQFLTCSGELHIAYSLVENSVGIGRLAGGRDRVVRNGGRDRSNYWYEGKVYKVAALPETILNLPLKGSVWMRFQDVPIGTFADDHAGKALGFGCFSGQTKKVANVKDVWKDGGPSKEEMAKFERDVRVSFETSQILTSSAAEDAIKSGLAEKAAADYDRSGQAGLDAAAADRASRKAASDARKLKYEQDLAAQQKAVADFEIAQQKMVADKAANAARAKAVQDEFARQQAVHRAELERHAKAQAEYEAQVVGQASVRVPKN